MTLKIKSFVIISLNLIFELISADIDSNFGQNFNFKQNFQNSNQNIVVSNLSIDSKFKTSLGSTSYFQDPNERIDHNSTSNFELNFSSTFGPELINANYINNNESTNQFDNCTKNPCINGFCLINQTNPLGYNCYCKDGFTGYQCQIKYDECKPDFCKNGATCVHEDAGLICFCKNGYKGKYCEELIDNCSSSPCLNEGYCKNFVNGYTCTCKDGFYGINCEKDVEVCEKSTCQNNGTCIEGLGLSYTCECQLDYKGKHCEIKIDRCKPNPCKNDGECLTIVPGDFLCKCSCDYTGKYCENKVMFCKEPDYCLNGGVCVIVEDHHLILNTSKIKYEKNICYCKPKYYGEKCEFSYSKCLSSGAICENNGTCLDSNKPNEPFTCECKDTFRGKYCEIDCKKTGDCPIINDRFETTPTVSFHINEQSVKTALNTPTLSFTPTQQDASTIYFTNTSFATSTPNLITPTFSFQSFYTSPSIGSTESYQDLPYFNVTEESKDNKSKQNSKPTLNSSDHNLNGTSGEIDQNSKDNNQNKLDSMSRSKRIFSPRFNGLSMNTSFLQFEKDKYELPTTFVLHFDFSTNASDAILFYTEAELNPIVFVIIYLEDGLLKLSFSCNQESTLYLISDKHHQLNNEQINHVQMHFRLNLKKGICESQIQLNNSLSINKNQTSSISSDSKICLKYFNFGNKQSDNPFLPRNLVPFRGCLRNIYINNNLKLVKNAIRAENLEECNSNKICDLFPCGQHGECLIRKRTNNLMDTPYDHRFKREFTFEFKRDLDFFKQLNFNRGPNNEKNVQSANNTQLTNDNYNNKLNNYLSNDDWTCKCLPGYFGTFCEFASCEKNPCANQSVCFLVSNSELSCVCPESKFGDYCNLDFKYDAARFKKESFMVLPVEIKNNFIEISFNFTTVNLEQVNAIFLYMGQPQSTKKMDFLSLTLDKLFVNFKIRLAHYIKEITAKLSEHQNLHQIRLGYSRQFFWLSVDKQQKIEDHLYPLQESFSLNEDRLYVGGHQLVRKVDRLIDVDFFEGCIFNISIRTNQQNSSFYLVNKIISNYNIGKCEEIECK